MRAERLDALLFPAGYGALLSARPGYPTVIVPFGMVANVRNRPLPPDFEAKPSPFGVSFAGGACSEPRLIALAYAFEQATKRRVPPASGRANWRGWPLLVSRRMGREGAFTIASRSGRQAFALDGDLPASNLERFRVRVPDRKRFNPDIHLRIYSVPQLATSVISMLHQYYRGSSNGNPKQLKRRRPWRIPRFKLPPGRRRIRNRLFSGSRLWCSASKKKAVPDWIKATELLETMQEELQVREAHLERLTINA
jgi:hypothetical protein